MCYTATPQAPGDGINNPNNSATASSAPTGTSTNPSNTSIANPTSGTNTSLSRDGDAQSSGSETIAGNAETAEGGPPPLPGKHEGKPSSTWTPPFVGNTGNASQVCKLTWKLRELWNFYS